MKSSVPKKIHFIWMQDANQVPDKYLDNIRSAQYFNPNWQILIWDETSIKELLQHMNTKYLDKFNSFTVLHQKVDFGRYAILCAHGGISVDIDAKTLKPFDQIPYINEQDFIVGYSSLDAIGRWVQGYKERVINNATIITCPNHPVIKEVLDYIITLECKPGQSDFSCVIFSTGQSFNDVVKKYKGEIVVLDNSYFEACHHNDEYCELPNNAILEHKHEQTWVSQKQKRTAKIYFWLKKNWLLLLSLILIVSVIISFSRNMK